MRPALVYFPINPSCNTMTTTKYANYPSLKLTRTTSTVLVAALLSSCATLDKNPQIGETFSNIGGAISGGVTKVTSKFAPRSKASNNAQKIAAQFPTNQMPHTMMQKPVGEGRLSSGYGYRINPKGVRLPKRHKGVDYAAPTGTPIYAAASGVVSRLYVSTSYGKYISLDHENDFTTAYAHMNSFADGLEVGSKVSRGDIIGQVGSTGKSSGAHLHFELKYKGVFIDPLFEVIPAEILASDDTQSEDT